MKLLLNLICYLFIIVCVCSQDMGTRNLKIYPNNLIRQPLDVLDESDGNQIDGKVKGRIINGKNATSIADFPFQVRLILKSKSQSTEEQAVYTACGGSIIGPNWILTACHCIIGASDGWVFAGCVNTADVSGSCRKIPVKENQYYWHADYNNSDTNTQNDIGLIWLSESLTFSENIAQIVLNKEPNIQSGKSVALSGYGVTETGELSDRLKYTNVDIIDEELCKKTFPCVNPSSICYGTNGRTSDCQGDSGGPMTINVKGIRYLVGVTSYGGPTCLDYPGVYTRVSYFLKWICFITKICN